MVKPNEKGGEFERLISKRLSQWIIPGTDRTLFWRSSMSGGRNTVMRARGKQALDQSSDIGSIAPESAPFVSVFTIECKHVKTLNIAGGVVNGTQELPLFWRQVSRDAAHAGKRPLLIARQNAWPILALLRTDDLKWFFGVGIHAPERARLFKLSSRPLSVSMLTLEGLLSSQYAESLICIQSK